MQSTPNLRDTDPHDVFVIEPDVSRADKAPLDLLFIGADGRIITIAANAVPYSDAESRSGSVSSSTKSRSMSLAACSGFLLKSIL